MSYMNHKFVIYNKGTTVVVGGSETERGAKMRLTRMVNTGVITERNEHAIVEFDVFYNTIEKFVERTNLMSRKKYMERINTPGYCSPSCESYWSM